MNLIEIAKSVGATYIYSKNYIEVLGFQMNKETLQAFADAITKEKDAEIEKLEKQHTECATIVTRQMKEIEQLNAKVAMMREALGAMTTCFGIDEDEWNHGTMKHARQALAATEQDVTRWVNCVTDEAYRLGGKHMIELLVEGYEFDFEPDGLNASIKYQLSLPYENKITIRQRRGKV